MKPINKSSRGADVRALWRSRGRPEQALVAAAILGAALFLPSNASAATASITSVAPSPSGGLTVTTAVTVDLSDCSTYGYCGWFLELSAVPANQSCTAWNEAELAGSGNVVTSVGTTSVTVSALLNQPGLYEICVFADLPNDLGTPTYLTNTTYTTPAATGTVSVAAESGTQLGGTVSINEPYCDTYCVWSANTYEEDNSTSCSTSPSGRSISTGPDEYDLGEQSWTYSFTPDVSTGELEVCSYLEDGPLVASSGYAFPAAELVTVVKTSTPKPRLLISTGRAELSRALLKRFKGATKLALTCGSLSRVAVRCSVSLTRAEITYRGSATARLSGKLVHLTWALKRGSSTKPVTANPTTTTSTQTTQTPSTGSCTPLSNEGTCYEPGEYCRETDHGLKGIAGDGEAIECEDNDGWRWEPTG